MMARADNSRVQVGSPLFLLVISDIALMEIASGERKASSRRRVSTRWRRFAALKYDVQRSTHFQRDTIEFFAYFRSSFVATRTMAVGVRLFGARFRFSAHRRLLKTNAVALVYLVSTLSN